MFKKIKESRIYENIVDQVFEAILIGDLKPADKLPSENELVKIFGVSRVTVREAIRYLEQLGVLEVRQGSMGGAFVKEVDLGDIAAQMGNVLRMANVTFLHMAEARAVLEQMILGKLVHPDRTKEWVKKLLECVDRAEDHFRKKEHRERIRANFQFHGLIAELTGNPIVILMHKIIVDLSMVFFENVKPSTSMIMKTLEDHRHIAELLEQGKTQEAADICAEHIREVSGRIVDKSKTQSFLRSKIGREDPE
ncbi:MAG: FadR family transcriptional regulator [Desulfobacteraceae bacterium]|nr:MAG: FadR family transcriptional regulator [Desulfobacteraceae bacterium]